MLNIRCNHCGKKGTIKADVCPHCGLQTNKDSILLGIHKNMLIRSQRQSLIIGIISVISSILVFFSLLSNNLVNLELDKEVDFSGFSISMLLFIVGILTIFLRKKTNKFSFFVPVSLNLLTSLFAFILFHNDSHYRDLYKIPLILGVFLLMNMLISNELRKKNQMRI